jgi:hypothetical protein
MSRLWADTARTSYYCTVSVVLRDTTAAASALSGVRVSGEWTMTPNGAAAWSAGTTTLSSSSTGSVSWRSGNVSKNPGGSCQFSIKAATLSGYQLDSTLSVMSRTLSW